MECIFLLIYPSIHLSFNYLINKLNSSGLFSSHYTKRKITSGISPVWGLEFSYWVWLLFKWFKWFLIVNHLNQQRQCLWQSGGWPVVRAISECRENRWWKNKVWTSLWALCSMEQLYLNRKGACYCTTFLVICSFSFITSSLLVLGREFWREAWHIRKMWKQSTICKNNKESHEQWTQSKQQKCQCCWDWPLKEPGRQVTTSTAITLPPVCETGRDQTS